MKRETDPEMEAKVRQFMGQHIPKMANARLVNSKICLYTMTPDEHFLIDRHPAYPHIVIGAGFSGHGFKFSTLIGKLLADLAMENPIELDLSMFRIDRF
jgi:glycine/D-amino acid oxidase-like deaminating enzyme